MTLLARKASRKIVASTVSLFPKIYFKNNDLDLTSKQPSLPSEHLKQVHWTHLLDDGRICSVPESEVKSERRGYFHCLRNICSFMVFSSSSMDEISSSSEKLGETGVEVFLVVGCR
jgi:hypothetical protein